MCGAGFNLRKRAVDRLKKAWQNTSLLNYNVIFSGSKRGMAAAKSVVQMSLFSMAAKRKIMPGLCGGFSIYSVAKITCFSGM